MYIRQIFLIQMEYRLQCMYNHMVERTTYVISPFYTLLPGKRSESDSKKYMIF